MSISATPIATIQTYQPFFNNSALDPNPKNKYRVGVDIPSEPIVIPLLASADHTIILNKHLLPNRDINLQLFQYSNGTGTQINTINITRLTSPDQHFYQIKLLIDTATITTYGGQTFYAYYDTTGQFIDDNWAESVSEKVVEHDTKVISIDGRVTTLEALSSQVTGGVPITVSYTPANNAVDVLVSTLNTTAQFNKWTRDTATGTEMKLFLTALDRTNGTNAITGTLVNYNNRSLKFTIPSNFSYGSIIYGRVYSGLYFVDGSYLSTSQDFQFTVEAVGQVNNANATAIGSAASLTVKLTTAHKSDTSLTYDIAQNLTSTIIAANVTWTAISAGQAITGTFVNGDNIFIRARQGTTYGTWSNAVIATVVANAAPVASVLSIAGTATKGSTLTGNYTYSDGNGDLEGVSTFKWYNDTQSSGATKVAISGATAKTYVVADADVGKYVFFEVTPVATTGTLVGLAVVSSGTNIPVPIVSGLAVAPGSTQNTLTWTASGIAGAIYNLYFNTTGAPTTASTKLAGVTSGYVHTGLTNGTTYYYVIEEVVNSVTSALSNVVSEMPRVFPYTVLNNNLFNVINGKMKASISGGVITENPVGQFTFSSDTVNKAASLISDSVVSGTLDTIIQIDKASLVALFSMPLGLHNGAVAWDAAVMPDRQMSINCSLDTGGTNMNIFITYWDTQATPAPYTLDGSNTWVAGQAVLTIPLANFKPTIIYEIKRDATNYILTLKSTDGVTPVTHATGAIPISSVRANTSGSIIYLGNPTTVNSWKTLFKATLIQVK